MTDLAVIELLTFVLAIPLSYFMARIIKRKTEIDFRKEIDSDYLREWSGNPDDEYYAWLRLRYRYICQDSPGYYLKYIDRKLRDITKRNMLSGFSVTGMGDVVPTNTFEVTWPGKYPGLLN